MTDQKRDYAMYQVALKILLRKGEEFLFLRCPDGALDIPGGRIDNVESATPLMKILDREIREEIGIDVRYKVGMPLFQFRRAVQTTYNLLTVYEGEFLGGTITLSHEHVSYEWLTRKRLLSSAETILLLLKNLKHFRIGCIITSTAMKGNRGFIKMILLIVIALVVLGYFGYNLKDIVNSPTVHDNLVYVWDLLVKLWNNILAEPVTWIWDKIQTALSKTS